jgi:hypothetical protein
MTCCKWCFTSFTTLPLPIYNLQSFDLQTGKQNKKTKSIPSEQKVQKAKTIRKNMITVHTSLQYLAALHLQSCV